MRLGPQKLLLVEYAGVMIIPPTIADPRTEDGSGGGSFSSRISGLTPFTTYFVRAYAKSRYGTTYGNTLTFKTLYGGELVTDIDGNIYHTVTIGSQIWMVENLRVTHFRNGTPLILAIDSLMWSAFGDTHYCYYQNDTQNAETYGALYNQQCILDSRGLAPTGWHIPNLSEFQTLIDYLGGEAVAGGKLKEFATVHWNQPNLGANNESGFTALPGGCRMYKSYFEGYGLTCNMWSSYPWGMLQLNYNDSKTLIFYMPGSVGASVRCIKD